MAQARIGILNGGGSMTKNFGGELSRSAKKRKHKIVIYLSGLACSNPIRFRHEWAKRVNSAVELIKSIAKGGRLDAPLLFGVADKLIENLKSCGADAERLALKATREVLFNECCQAVASMILKSDSASARQNLKANIYKISAYGFKEAHKRRR